MSVSYFRTLGFCAVIILWFLFAVVPMPVLFLNRKWVVRFGKLTFSLLFFLLEKICKITTKVEGIENIPNKKAFLIASKHLSAWETFYIAYYFNLPVYVLKRVLMLIPIFGWYMWRAGMFPINRKGGEQTKQMIAEKAFDVIKNEQRIFAIFPQGTRTPTNETYSLEKYPYKRGLYSICQRLPQTEVLLIAHNASKFFGKNFFSKKTPGVIIIKFLKPITLGNKTEFEFLNEVQTKIEAETNKII